MGADCGQVRAELRAGAPFSPSSREHAAGCEACGRLLADDAALGKVLAAVPEPGEDDALADRILGRIDAERNPLPRLPATVRAIATWAVIVAPGIAFLALRPRADLQPATLGPWLAGVGAWVVAGLAAARVALRPLHRAATTLPAAWIALGLAAPFAIGLGGVADVGPVLPPAIHCFSRGAATALVVLAVLRLADRRSRAPMAWWAGASALAAVSGGLMLHASCDLTGVVHLVLAHASIGLAIALGAGAIAATRATGP